MTSKVLIPTPLRPFVDNKEELEVQSSQTVADALAQLVDSHPTVKNHLYDESGNLRRYINIYVNDEDIRYLDGEKTILEENAELSIIPAIAGG